MLAFRSPAHCGQGSLNHARHHEHCSKDKDILEKSWWCMPLNGWPGTPSKSLRHDVCLSASVLQNLNLDHFHNACVALQISSEMNLAIIMMPADQEGSCMIYLSCIGE